MKKQISRISVVQTSKVIAIFYVAFSLLYALIGIPLILLGEGQVKVVGFTYLFMPIFIGVFGFVFVALACWVYNVIAGKFGGVEFEVKDLEESTDLPV
jgi:hypothetical protein